MERKRSSRAGVGSIPESHRLQEEIAQHEQDRQALLASEERYRILLEHLPVGVYRTTPEGRIIEANPSLADMIGAQKISDLYSLDVQNLYVKKRDRDEHLHKLDSKTTFFSEFELRRLDGRRIWVRDLPHAVKDLGGRILYYDGIIVDITARKKAEKQLHKALLELERVNHKLISQSLTDDLTGLHNRRGFFTLGQQTLKIAKRLHDNVCLLYLDIDSLKAINDTWGHKAGDQALADFGRIIREAFRESDIISRIGGDEFAVLILTSSPKRDRVLLERLKEKLTAYNQKRANKFKISVSIGLVRRAASRQPSLDNLIRLADRQMYRQKHRKRKPDALAASL
jgi:diguanylate cyclase (GGDEF)-like protein/PAS domain S-box-containing protein